MNRKQALLSLVACMLLPATLLVACRAEEPALQVAGTETAGSPVRPLEGTVWPGDPPAVSGAVDPLADAARAAERERELAEREAAVAAREATVAQRESALASAPPAASRRPSSTPRVSRPAAPVSRPAPAPRDPEPEPAPPWREPVEEPEPVRRSYRLTVPAGTAVAAELQSGVSTATAQVGDSVTARVAEDVHAGGEVAIPAGSTLRGSVSAVQGLRRVGGRAMLALRFDTVELPSGADLPIYASWQREGRRETRRDAATIGGSAVGGAILGRVLDRHLPGDRDRNTAVGAAVGAAVGTVIAARNRGDVELPAGSALDLTLADSVTVTRR